MVAIGVALLLGVAIYVGFRWHPSSLAAYLTAVGATLALWGTAIALRRSYAGVLPGLSSLLASVSLGLVGARAVWRIQAEGAKPPWVWLLATALALAPIAVTVALWLPRSGIRS